MKILDRLMLGIFLRAFLSVFVVLLTLFEVISFFDLIDDFVRFNAPWDLILTYFIMRLPEAAFNMAPMAVLIGGILTFSAISRTHEVIIMMASGMSVWRIARPVLFGAFVISGLVFLNCEYLMPPTIKKARQIFDYEIRNKTQAGLVRRDQVWIKGGNEAIWNIGLYDPVAGRLYDVKIMRMSANNSRYQSITEAKTAELRNGVWTLFDGRRRAFTDTGDFSQERFDEREVASTLQIEQLKEVEKQPQEMNLAEIAEYVQKIKMAGFDDTRYTVDMMAKVAFPFVCFVMGVLAVPFSIKTSRAGGNMLGIATGVFLGFLFWFTFSMGTSLGNSGKLPPVAAVLSAHAIFLTFAILRTEQMYGTLLYRLVRLFRS